MRAHLGYVGAILLFLCGLGCQPYIDHGRPLDDFRANMVDFGVRRQLDLVRHAWDGDGLVVEFNQPLGWVEDEAALPFVPEFRPRIPVESVSRHGAAGVRIEFARQLPGAHRYTMLLPAGWRALTGASFVRAEELEWETPRPRLVEVKRDGSSEDPHWRLLFNQPVDEESLARSLEVERESGAAEPSPLRLRPAGPKEFHLYLPVAQDERVALLVKPGLQSMEGPLEGLGGERFVLQNPLKVDLHRISDSEVRLDFSEAVERREILRSLKGAGPDNLSLTGADEKSYRLSLPGAAREVAVTLVGGLTARDGSRLSRSVELLLGEERTLHREPPPREVVVLPPGHSVLAGAAPAGSRVGSWRVSDAEALDLLLSPARAWAGRAALTVESREPVFSAELEKAAPAIRFLPRDERWSKERPHGLFLVRVALPGGQVRRTVIARTSLRAEAWAVNGKVAIEAGAAGVEVELLDRNGAVLATGETDREGMAAVEADGSSLRVVRLSSGEQRTFIAPVRLAVPEPRHSPGSLWLQRNVLRPGETVAFLGLWPRLEEPPGLEIVHTLDGRVVRAVDASPSGSFFSGTIQAPARAGHYSLRAAGGSGVSASFAVSPLIEGRSSLSLEVRKEAGAGSYSGSYSWDGPGAERLELRASLHPRLARVEGWTEILPGRPNWMPLEVERTTSLEGGSFTVAAPPPLGEAYRLVVELYDRESPEAVLATHTVEVGETPISLEEASERTVSPGVKRVAFRFQVAGGTDEEELPCRLLRRHGGGWTEVDQGKAVRRDGSFRWAARLEGAGDFRLECFRGESSRCWERSVPPAGLGAARKPLELWPAEIAPGEPFTVRWPGLPEGSRVWLSVLDGNGRVQTSRRETSVGGGLGELTLLPPPGQLEAVVVAGHRGEVRTGVLRIAEATGEGPAYTVEPSEPAAGQAVVVEVEAGDAPLHAMLWWDQEDLPMLGPVELAGLERLELPAPARPGEHRLRFVAHDQGGRYVSSDRRVSLAEPSRRTTLTPPSLRPGDAFWAGVRYGASTRAGTPVGATSTALPVSGLLPLNYLTTAVLVEPGSKGDMLFHYRAPQFVPGERGETELHWELGVEGEAVPLSATIRPLPSGVSRSLHRRRELQAGQALRLDLAELDGWELRLTKQSAGEGLVEVLGEREETAKLSDDAPVWERSGSEGGAVGISHRTGPPLRVELFHLQLEPPEDGYSATTLYLLRRVESLDGRGKLKTLAGERVLLAHYLVLPEGHSERRLLVPVPGGAEATGCWARTGEGLTALPWVREEGAVAVSLPSLRAGEHEIVVAVAAVTPGDYSWPSSRVTSSGGEALASTPAGRLSIGRD